MRDATRGSITDQLARATGVRRTVLMTLPPAAAVFVFGVVYGALARPHLGVVTTMLSSLLIFSGSVQFTLLALVTAGAGAAALLAGAATLNLRNLILGAVLRPRMKTSRARRAALGWFLTDEAAGLALVSDQQAERVLLISGAFFYLSWQLGTALGLAGAALPGLQEPAAAVFPVLFIGLAAMTCTSKSVAVRAIMAAACAGVAARVAPGSQAVVAVLAAILVALPSRRRR